ncbi:MAG: DUF4157 domain-containing protein [Mycobacteriaceae bacterium]
MLLTRLPHPSSPFPLPALSASAPSILAGGRTVRLLSLGGTRTDGLLARVRAELGAAVDSVEWFWGTDWGHGDDPEITVAATDSEAQFLDQAHLDIRRRWADIAAVSVADEVDLAERATSGQRIVFAPGASAMNDSALRIVLTHELFHLAARSDTALDAPRWLTEGVADFVARPPSAIPAGTSAELPSDAALDESGVERSAAYDRAWWFARFVADTYGTDGLRRLYAAACGPHHADLAVAVQQTLGTDLPGLKLRWASWLTTGRG